MGLGQLKDAALRERRRRLLGADMVAAVRRPSRAQLGALVNGERQTHSHLAAVSALASCFHICVLLLLKGRQAVLIMGTFFVCFFFRLLQVKKKEDWRL